MTAGVLTDGRARGGERGSDFAALSREIKQAGLLRRTPVFYAVKIAATVLAYAGAWVAFVLVGQSWWQLAVAAVLAVLFTQIGFLGHDAGHKQIFTSKKLNDLTGVVLAGLFIGLSYGWWVGKHNKHHANPNHTDKDPDFHAGAVLWTEEQAVARRGVVSRFVGRHQAWFFLPMTSLEGLSLRISSIQALRARPVRNRVAEGSLLVVHTVAFLTTVFLVLPPLQAVGFIALQQGLFGIYLSMSFVPNHIGMDVVRADDGMGFLRKQVLTSRDVRGGRLTDFALGGLNYQIEHHLFPNMPRRNLRRAQPIVEAFCHRQGIRYARTSLMQSYREAWAYLRQVGEPLRLPMTPYS